MKTKSLISLFLLLNTAFLFAQSPDTSQVKVSTKTLKAVEILDRRSTFVNSIDRKIYNVGEDLMSKTGSVSELLQNVPSVQVDLEGNISLRGSSDVMVLINGKPSALMGANRAAVLQQMPANTIEKIEVITNPSAKYKPDGTSGIINIVLKKNKTLGFNGSVTLNAGNDNRYNGNIMLNYNPGKLNLFASYSLRQDDRLRYGDTYRKRTDLITDSLSYYKLHSTDHSRPISHILQAGVEYKLDDHTRIGTSGSFNYRDMIRRAVDTNSFMDSEETVTRKYDRSWRDPEYEKDLEFNAFLQHTFSKEGHELNFDFTSSRSMEQEDNHFTNTYYIPVGNSTYDNTLIKQGGDESQFTAEYINPISEDISFEAGYILESRTADMDFYGEKLISNVWEADVEKTNRFKFNEQIHVLYSTYSQQIGDFGFLAGLRAEEALVNTDQVTINVKNHNQYFRLYPSIHTSYKLSENHELQFNYSHRIRRPEGDEMNPFPEYRDPYNLRIGNPGLKPADIHSIEFGYQYKKNNTTFLTTAYYRSTYNGFTEITRFINDSIKLSTSENLAKSSSAGLEVILSTKFGNFATMNLGTNAFYQTIDASSLGYSSNKSTVSWSANMSTGLNLTKSTVMQITSSYSALRLTPQGQQLPTFVLNTGLKQELFNRKATVLLTVSDLFNSMKGRSIIDIPELYESSVRSRSARMIYLGFTYTFGNEKKEKENVIKFDNQL